MSQRRQRLYRRLDRAERAAIERGLDKNRPARAMARDLGRSQSSVADEVRRNRTVTRGPGKGSRVESVPEGACARLRGWPHVCNGCNRRRYHCSMPFRCEYSAARAQLLADGELSAVNANIVSTDWANVSPRPRQPIPANRTNVLSPTAPTELCSPMALPHRDRSDYWMKGTSWAS